MAARTRASRSFTLGDSAAGIAAIVVASRISGVTTVINLELVEQS